MILEGSALGKNSQQVPDEGLLIGCACFEPWIV